MLIVTDPGVSALGAPHRIADALRRYDIETEIFDGVHVEPTDDSMNKAVEYARAQGDVGRVRRRRRRVGDRHRQGDQPADHPPRRADGLHQQADRQGQGPAGRSSSR